MTDLTDSTANKLFVLSVIVDACRSEAFCQRLAPAQRHVGKTASLLTGHVSEEVAPFRGPVFPELL